MAFSLLMSLAIGYAIYLLSEPSVRDLRPERVLTKSDLASVNDELHQLYIRLSHIEQGGVVTPEDLEKLRTRLEEQINEAKSGAR